MDIRGTSCIPGGALKHAMVSNRSNRNLWALRSCSSILDILCGHSRYQLYSRWDTKTYNGLGQEQSLRSFSSILDIQYEHPRYQLYTWRGAKTYNGVGQEQSKFVAVMILFVHTWHPLWISIKHKKVLCSSLPTQQGSQCLNLNLSEMPACTTKNCLLRRWFPYLIFFRISHLF